MSQGIAGASLEVRFLTTQGWLDCPQKTREREQAVQ